MKGLIRSAGAVTVALVLLSCGDDETTNPTPDGPTIVANASDLFVPGTLDIDVGETVTWVFGAVSHDVLFSNVPGAPASIGITANANVNRTFGTAGVFPYSCTLHAGMAGTVRVGQ
jgi:plastocyanin